jgi:hypothetical protein
VFLLLTLCNFIFSQTKVSGIVVDKKHSLVPLQNIASKDLMSGRR